MGYRIAYGQKSRKNKGYRWYHLPITLLLIILAIINGIYYCSGNFSNLREKLMPWTQPEVQSAFCALRNEIADGQPMGESVAAFCLEILNGSGKEEAP